MTYKTSTGLRNHMLVTGSLKNALDGGSIKIYAGTEPATADASIGGATLLTTITISSGATGLSLDTVAASGVVTKPSGATWSGTNAASGTATFYRHVATGDDGTASTTQARIQGSVSSAGAEMNLSNPVLTSGATQTIDYYAINLPTF